MNQKIDILIADDHNLFRKGLVALLSDFDFVDKIFEAANGLELLIALESLNPKPEIVLLDLRMPEMDGMAAFKEIHKTYPEIKVLILSMEDDSRVILQLIEQGVNGYLFKYAEPEELELALIKVIEKDMYFPEEITQFVLSNFSKQNIKRIERNHFTKRELEVLQLICEEKTAGEIGENLSISTRTVEGHKQNLFQKTNTKNLAGLVVFAIKNNLVSI